MKISQAFPVVIKLSVMAKYSPDSSALLQFVSCQTIHFMFIHVVLIGVLLGRRGKGHVARRGLQGVGWERRGKSYVARNAMLRRRWMLL
ncbi:hypothetical protein E2C01_065186 [Portunus trituberculatus]|uniref:Uncharacterized protein n=1 Tax=Portunus trituberculatus TaxID=210409 RepID=A0A5B7HL77_PORTR|nr:hypothetical protein [Portunus trituberculatus]